MSFIAESRRNKLWFGTEERMGWFPTPNRSPDLSPSGWADGGTLLNGGGFQLNSFGSHKEYIFEWPQSSQMRHSQLMKSYADGSFGRGLIYFLDPLIYTKNVLPAMWADPSMGIGYEGSSLVYGVDPTALPTSNWEANELPIKSAYYDLGSIATGWRGKEDAVFIPVPEGYTFSFGSIHSQSGQGRVYYRTQSKAGALGTITEVTPLPTNTAALVNTFVSGVDLAGVWLFIGKAAAGAGSVTLSAMTGRLLPSVKAVVAPVATNLFTNPRLVGDGTWAEVRRNLHPNPTNAGAIVDGVPSGSLTYTTGSATGTRAVENGWQRLRPTSIPAGSMFGVRRIFPTPCLAGDKIRIYGSKLGTMPEGLRLRVYVDATKVAGGIESFQVISETGAFDYTYTLANDIVQVNFYYWLEPVSGSWTGTGDIGLSWFTFEVNTTGAPFSGSTTDFSIDPDMRQRWVGALHNSPSVMEIERVAGLTGLFCIPGVSKKDGKPALRVIPTDTSTSSRVHLSVPSALRGGGTVVGTAHLDAPLTAPLHTYSRRLAAINPGYYSDPVPNEAGAYPTRVVYGELNANYFVQLWNGGTQGSGDVWYTDIGLFAGSYDGPVFNGSSGTIMIGSQLATTEWDGTIDNSTSTAYSTSAELINIRKGPWIGGQGHSGCRFIGKPTYSPLSPINGGQVGFSASFKEVGSWVNG